MQIRLNSAKFGVTYGNCSKFVTVPVDLLPAVVEVVDPVLSVRKDAAGARVEFVRSMDP